MFKEPVKNEKQESCEKGQRFEDETMAVPFLAGHLLSHWQAIKRKSSALRLWRYWAL